MGCTQRDMNFGLYPHPFSSISRILDLYFFESRPRTSAGLRNLCVPNPHVLSMSEGVGMGDPVTMSRISF